VHHAVLIGLIVFVASTGVGLGFAVVRGLEAWRTLRSFQRTTLRRLGQLEAEIAKIEKRGAKAAETAARLDVSVRRLQESLATASVIARAAGDVWSLVGGVRGVVPTK
jgi:hypothetical protein